MDQDQGPLSRVFWEELVVVGTPPAWMDLRAGGRRSQLVQQSSGVFDGTQVHREGAMALESGVEAR